MWLVPLEAVFGFCGLSAYLMFGSWLVFILMVLFATSALAIESKHNISYAKMGTLADEDNLQALIKKLINFKKHQNIYTKHIDSQKQLVLIPAKLIKIH